MRLGWEGEGCGERCEGVWGGKEVRVRKINVPDGTLYSNQINVPDRTLYSNPILLSTLSYTLNIIY